MSIVFIFIFIFIFVFCLCSIIIILYKNRFFKVGSIHPPCLSNHHLLTIYLHTNTHSYFVHHNILRNINILKHSIYKSSLNI